MIKHLMPRLFLVLARVMLIALGSFATSPTMARARETCQECLDA